MQPDRILVGRAPRVGGDAPAGLNLAAVDQREDQVGIADVDRQNHARALAMSALVHNSTSPARTMSTVPSSQRRRSAPSGSIPSNRPELVSSALEWTVNGVPCG